MNWRYLTLPILLSTLLLSGCATNPVTGEQDFVTLSEEQEIAQGRQYHQSIIAQYGVYNDPELQAYVDRIGQDLAAKSHRAHLEFHFTLLDTPDINAFALPGGYVYITRGIMAYLDSEAELAGVLGHEIGHVTARHSVRQQSGQLATGLLNVLISAATGSETLSQLGNQVSTAFIRGYGRKHELEADRLGAEYLHRTGYNPETMLKVIGVLKDQELYEIARAKKENRKPNIYHGVFSTHPENDDRLKTVIRAAKNLSVVEYREDNQAGYLELIDRMTWGQNPDQGVILENRFMHADLGFALEFPAGWKIENRPDILVARSTENSAQVQLRLVGLQEKETLAGLLKRLTKNSKLAVEQQDYGSTARTTATVAGVGQPARVSAIKLDQKQALFIAGTSVRDQFEATNAQLLKINTSFTRLSPEQIKDIKTPILKIVPVKPGDSFTSIASQSAINTDAEDTLRLLNRAFPEGSIDTYESVKTIIFSD
ncbi:MAG: M48 family metalloprotease [Gammaproteobacteria bacterium]|nr:M48 family metalloprotease [Gammaproteobacteria bacterium]